jgi:hemolysin activation/secretion protein
MFAQACRVAAALAMVCVSCAAFAQAIPSSALPGRERERFTLPVVPLPEVGAAAIAVPGVDAPAGSEKIALILRGVRIKGSTVYSPEQLKEIYAELIGKTVTVKTLYEIAQQITARYGKDGYVLSRALVPPQQLKPTGAVVEIQIVEGYVDKVEWPAKLSEYRDFFSYYADKITAERPANIATMERYLLLAGDLPGLKFTNSLKPHPTKTGAAIMMVEVTEKQVDAIARIDNRGTPARGPTEFLVNSTINNLMRMHDSLTWTYAGSFKAEELQFHGLTYRQVLNPEGLTGFVNASYGYGRPGTVALISLQYQTKSAFLESGLSYPIIRSRESNLIVTGLTFASDDRSSIFEMPDTPPSTHDSLRGIRGRVDADWADKFNGVNQVNFTASHGFIGLGSTDNMNPLASRLNGRVDFSKLELALTRQQVLFDRFSLLVAAYGQYAATPLLISELCSYGGRVFGRAFDPSQFVGDSCINVLAELRFDIPHQINDLTQAQLYAFWDHGHLHNKAPDLGTFTDVDAASIGAGLRLGWLTYLTADFTVARVMQGGGLTGTQAVPVAAQTEGPHGTRFFFVLAAKL